MDKTALTLAEDADRILLVDDDATNLDVLRPPSGLVENAVLQGRARGNGNMPAGLFSGEDAKQVAAYVAAVAGR